MAQLWNLAFLFVGAVVTWAVARHYYGRATNDLRGELEGVLKQLDEATSEIKLWITAMS